MIRLANKNDIPILCEISEKAFGKGFHNDKYFEKSNGECIVYTDETSKILGYCQIIRTSRGIKISSITVLKEARGKGIASALIEDVLLEHPHEYIYTYAWRRNGEVALAPILNRLGFIEKEEIPKYWYQDSIEKAYICPECGNPCYCSTLFYEK